eukprot:6064124-Prymnesium_polylepis.2
MLRTIGFTVYAQQDLLMNVLLSLEYESTLTYGGAAWAAGHNEFNSLPGSVGWTTLVETNRHYPMVISTKNHTTDAALSASLCYDL